MPVNLHFGADDFLRVRFAVSPLCETHEAVRTLRRTDRHGYHVPWLRRTRRALDGLDLTPLWLFMPSTPPGYTPDFLGRPPDTPMAGFDEELARLRATDPALARAEMAKSLAGRPDAARSARGRAALADPARAVAELADVTERAWRALLAPDWPRLRALLEAEIAYRSRQLAGGGLRLLFADLHPRLSWSGGTLTVRTRTDFVQMQDPDGRGVLLLPSVFVWPDVVSGFDPPWQPTVIYPARGIGGLWTEPATGPALARLLGANRAAVLAALDAPRPRRSWPTASAWRVVRLGASVRAARRRAADLTPGRAPGALCGHAAGDHFGGGRLRTAGRARVRRRLRRGSAPLSPPWRSVHR